MKTKSDWWNMAEAILPELSEYAARFGCTWDAEAATELLQVEDHRGLWVMFESLWERLPDSRRIRIAPFFALCDLCSEYYPIMEGK